MDGRRRYRFLGMALVAAFLLVILIVLKSSENIETALQVFGAVVTTGAALVGSEGVARNWSKKKEEPTEEPSKET